MVIKAHGLLLLCLGLGGCGSGLLDGTFTGDPRYVVHGTVTSLSANPGQFTSHITVLWQMTVPPPPSSSAANTSSSASDNPTTGAASPASPNGPVGAGAPTAPVAPTTPTVPGTGSIGGVAFPAPVSLTLLDTPQVDGQTAPQAVGLIVIFYDVDNDGAYTESEDIIAGTALDYRLLFLQDAGPFPEQLVNCIVDDPYGPSQPFMLGTPSCHDGIEHLALIPDTSVVITAGASPGCGTSP